MTSYDKLEELTTLDELKDNLEVIYSLYTQIFAYKVELGAEKIKI